MLFQSRFFFAASGKTSAVRQRRANGVREIPGTMIKDISTAQGGELHFQSMPTEISDSKSANWTPTEILGRSEPLQGYANSGPRVISFTLDFANSADYGDQPVHGPEANTPGGNTEMEPTEYVLNAVHWLQSLVYPDYDDEVGGLVKPPPVCALVIGELIRSRVICKDVQVTWRGPWEPDSLTPLFATVALTFEEVNETKYGDGPWGYKQVRLRENFTAAVAPVRNSFTALI